MNRELSKYVIPAFSFGIVSKITEAVSKFIALPLLITYLGIEKFGLLTLVMAINSYAQLLNFGMNIGGVKFLTENYSNKSKIKFNETAQISLGFYSIIILINIIILFFIQRYPQVFNLNYSDLEDFKNLLYISILFTPLNWLTSVFQQIFSSIGRIQLTYKINVVKSVFYLAFISIGVRYRFSLLNMFLMISVVNALPFFYLLFELLYKQILKNFLPIYSFKNHIKFIQYSLSIFSMGIFQFVAVQSKPLILKIFNSSSSNEILTEYRIIEVFPLFITTLGGLSISILLPLFTKLIKEEKNTLTLKLITNGTKISSFLISIICFSLILNSDVIIELYVGRSFSHLNIWMNLWFFTLILFLHNVPFATFVLASGKTRELVITSALSCVISIILNILLVEKYQVGSSVIAYLGYIMLQMSFYYLWIAKKYDIRNLSLFLSFIKPFSFGLILFIPVFYLSSIYSSLYERLLLTTVYIAIFTLTFYKTLKRSIDWS